MRDSAERAHLIRAHKRELSRLKLDKDAEIKKLVTAQEDTLRKALKQADAKMNVKLDDMRKALTEEYEEKLEEIEARHTQKFEEVSDEICVFFVVYGASLRIGFELSILSPSIDCILFIYVDATGIPAQSRGGRRLPPCVLVQGGKHYPSVRTRGFSARDSGEVARSAESSARSRQTAAPSPSR
jgi:hypothetical protein